jgi:hypothetical protein
VDHGSDSEQSFGLNESLFRLTQLREQLDEPDLLAPPEALDRVRRFLDEVFQPYLLTLLVPPVRYWQRGIVGYLNTRYGDLEAVADALHRFVIALRDHTWPGGANADWDEYTHSETLTLIGELGPHLDRIRLEREWWDRPMKEAPALRAIGPGAEPVQEPAEEDPAEGDRVPNQAAVRLLALARDDPETSVRTAALYAIADTDEPRPETLEVALRAAAAEDPQERVAAARLLARLTR